ncbi:unnamed protein product [Linum trigynum]
MITTLAFVSIVVAGAFSAGATPSDGLPLLPPLLPPLPALPPLSGWQPISNLTSVWEFADFAVTTHNHWAPVHQVKLVGVEKAASKVIVPSVNVLYQMVLTTVDGSAGVGVGTQQFKAVVGVLTSSATGKNVKTLLEFLPKLV